MYSAPKLEEPTSITFVPPGVGVGVGVGVRVRCRRRRRDTHSNACVSRDATRPTHVRPGCVDDSRTPRRAPPPGASSGAGRDRAPQYRSAGRVSRDPPASAVVPLVGHDLVEDRRVPVGDRGHGLQCVGGHRDRLGDRRRITLIGALHRHAHDRPGLQIDRVLGLVRQMRAAILHFRDARVGVVRMPPVGIAALLRALAIEARQVRPCRRLDARRLCEPCQKLLIRLAGIAPDDAAQRRVRLKRRRIDPDRLPLDHLRLPAPAGSR